MAIAESLKDVFKALRGRKKEPAPPAEDTEEELEDDGYEGDRRNDVKTVDLRGNKPKWSGLNKKYVYIAIMALILFASISLVLGGGNGKKKGDEAEEPQQVKRAVEGSHMAHMPVDYEELGRQEKERLAAEERRRREEEEAKKLKLKDEQKTPAVKTPDVPKTTRKEETAEEKAYRLYMAERAKALQSQIGFSVKGE